MGDAAAEWIVVAGLYDCPALVENRPHRAEVVCQVREEWLRGSAEDAGAARAQCPRDCLVGKHDEDNCEEADSWDRDPRRWAFARRSNARDADKADHDKQRRARWDEGWGSPGKPANERWERRRPRGVDRGEFRHANAVHRKVLVRAASTDVVFEVISDADD